MKKKVILNYELITLYYKEVWTIKYEGEDSLFYEHYEDAMVSLGILAKELMKVKKYPIKVVLYTQDNILLKESYLFPSLYETDFKKMLQSSLLNPLV